MRAEIRNGAKRQHDGRLARTTVKALFERYKQAVSAAGRGGRREAFRLGMLARDPVFAVPAAEAPGVALVAGLGVAARRLVLRGGGRERAAGWSGCAGTWPRQPARP